MKRKLVTLLIASLVVSMLGGCASKQTTFEYTIELGENYVFDATEIFGVSEEEAKEYEANLLPLDTKKAGTYEVEVTKGNEEFTVIYTVKDTKAPVVTMKENIVFTNSIENTDFSNVSTVIDGSKFTETLCKFEKLDDAKVLDDAAIKSYTDTISGVAKTEELLKRTDEIPSGDGVYLAVYLVEDSYGHKTANEVIVVLDTQTPVIEGVEDLETEISVEDPDAEWTDNLLDELDISDNVDGIITADMLNAKMELIDKENHVYEVNADYTDRAGNTTSVKYEITLKKKVATTNTGSTTGGGQTTPATSSSNVGYSYEDRDGDGYADLGETTVMNGYVVPTVDCRPEVAKTLNTLSSAGFYNVIYSDCYGGSYWMLVPYGETEKGYQFMLDYLASIGYGVTSMSADIFDENATATNIYVTARELYPLQ